MSAALAERGSWGLVTALLRRCAAAIAGASGDQQLPADVAAGLAAVQEAAGMALPAVTLVRFCGCLTARSGPPLRSGRAHGGPPAAAASPAGPGSPWATPVPVQDDGLQGQAGVPRSAALLLAPPLLQAAQDRLHLASPRAPSEA